MSLTLAQFEARVLALLMDDAAAIFVTAVTTEAVRLALHEYSEAVPLAMETVLTLPGTGHEIALSGVTGLLGVVDVWWPYDSVATSETWPPNRVEGWSLWWDDAQPVLYLNADNQGQPQIADELRLWYTKLHTIQNLDSAAATTVAVAHESLLVLGAAGFACLARVVDLSESAAATIAMINLGALGEAYLKQFRARLKNLRSGNAAGSARGQRPFGGAGWTMDQWDGSAG